ncbi:MAG: hypothetical protein JJ891_01850 [Rhizobiaceae bacterium]|nr:hypothetical protein [Rhizobiaceae bacterium]
MKIKFYNQADEVVLIMLADADNDWDACKEGWAMIGMGLIPQAIDFDVMWVE